MNTHIIRGEQKTTGKRFYISFCPAPNGMQTTYYKVPHARFATAMPKSTAAAHCSRLERDYPGNTYTTIRASLSIKPVTKQEGGKA